MPSPIMLIVLAIGAPALKDKLPAPPSIEGEWKVESRFDCGRQSHDDNIWIFSPGGVAEIREPVGRNAVSNLTYTLSSDGAVKAIDFLEGQGNGKSDPRQ